MQLTTIEEEYVRKYVDKAGWDAVERFQQLKEDADDAAKEAGKEAAREAEIEGLGPDEVEAAFDEAASKAWQEVWTYDAFGDDPPPGLIFCQPSEGAYIEAAEEAAEKRALATLAVQRTVLEEQSGNEAATN